MSKKHDAENIDIVRKILDDPQQSLSNSKDVYLNTLRQRLLNQSRHPFQEYTSMDQSATSLKPQVTIHHTHEIQKSSIEDYPQELSSPEHQVSDVDKRFFHPEEDLFEIEHVKEDEIPDFIEVKPKDQIDLLQSDEMISSYEKEGESTPLPKWELVEEDEEPFFEEKEVFKKEERTEEPVSCTEEEPDERETIIWEPADQQKMQEVPKKKKPLFKKFTREKPTFESVDGKEHQFLVKDLKTSIKKLQGKKPDSPFYYKGYTLYQKEMDLGNNKKRIIHFFSKDIPEDSTPSPLPKDYDIRVNKKTGVPYIRKKET